MTAWNVDVKFNSVNLRGNLLNRNSKICGNEWLGLWTPTGWKQNSNRTSLYKGKQNADFILDKLIFCCTMLILFLIYIDFAGFNNDMLTSRYTVNLQHRPVVIFFTLMFWHFPVTLGTRRRSIESCDDGNNRARFTCRLLTRSYLNRETVHHSLTA